MKRRLFVSLPLLAALAAAQNPADRLDEQVRAYSGLGRFNGSVLVARGGRVLLAKGYGMANFEWQIPNAADTKFRLGSITKPFTAASILQLELQGKLKTGDPVCNFMERCPGAWQPITIHHLLTHTSGIPNFTGFPDYTLTMAQASTMPDLLRRFSGKPLDFDAGTEYRYSNSGYVVLGHVIEKASGVSYEEYVRKHIFEPLGMKDTGYDRHATMLPKRAAGYEKRGEQVRNASHIDMSIPHAAGALYSTVEDLYKWDRALLGDKLLPQEARERMYTPFKGDYAYGWSVRRQDGVQIISHGGGINGFATMIMRAPEKDLCVVTLANVLPAEAGKVAADLLRLALGEEVALPKARVEISVRPEILDRYAGEYELKPGLVLKVWREGDRLMTQATGQPALQVFAEAENRFFPKMVDATLIFEPDAEGRMTVTLEQGGGRMKAPRK